MTEQSEASSWEEYLKCLQNWKVDDRKKEAFARKTAKKIKELRKEELRGFWSSYNDPHLLREKVLDKYGRKCAKCGYNSDMRLLQIDHTYNNGSQERRLMRDRVTFYQKVLADTEGNYQLLCSNCNLQKYYDIRDAKPQNVVHPVEVINHPCQIGHPDHKKWIQQQIEIANTLATDEFNSAI